MDLLNLMKDERKDKEAVFEFAGGIVSFVTYLNKNKNPLHKKAIYFQKTQDSIIMEGALLYNDGYAETIFSFANNIPLEKEIIISDSNITINKILNKIRREYKIDYLIKFGPK